MEKSFRLKRGLTARPNIFEMNVGIDKKMAHEPNSYMYYISSSC